MTQHNVSENNLTNRSCEVNVSPILLTRLIIHREILLTYPHIIALQCRANAYASTS